MMILDPEQVLHNTTHIHVLRTRMPHMAMWHTMDYYRQRPVLYSLRSLAARIAKP